MTTERGAGRIEALTGIRGLAALWVSYRHAIGDLVAPGALPHFVGETFETGWIAVDLFFVLSGFVISHVHAQDFTVFSWREYRRFLGLRIARIYPAHVVVALLWVPLVAGGTILGLYQLGSDVLDRFSLRTFLYSLTLLNGWGFPGSEGWNLPSWSVGSEWFAYLTFPLWGMTVCRLRSRWAPIAVATGVLGLMYLRAFAFHGGSQYMPSDAWFLTRVVSAFVIGCCMHVLFTHSTDRQRNDWIAAAATAVVLALPSLHLVRIYDGLYIALFAVIVFAVSRASGFVSGVLSSRPLVWLGNVSYSLYLIHVLIIVAIAHAAAMLGVRPTSAGASAILITAFTVTSLSAARVLFATVEHPARVFLRRTFAAAHQ